MALLPSGVTHIVIRDEIVSFFSFPNPPLVYVIKSPVVAQNYKAFFMMLWGMAENDTSITNYVKYCGRSS